MNSPRYMDPVYSLEYNRAFQIRLKYIRIHSRYMYPFVSFRIHAGYIRMRILITNVQPKFDNNVPAPLLFPCQHSTAHRSTAHTKTHTDLHINSVKHCAWAVATRPSHPRHPSPHTGRQIRQTLNVPSGFACSFYGWRMCSLCVHWCPVSCIKT